VSPDSESREQKPSPNSSARAPSSGETYETPPLERELAHLRSLQVTAIKDATYLGMTSQEGKDFEQRSLRIKEILAGVAKNKAEPL
jgi:hypothetical protein